MKTINVYNASWGCTDAEILVESLSTDDLPFLPRVGETMTTDSGHYLIKDVSYDVSCKQVALWICNDNSDFYTEELLDKHEASMDNEFIQVTLN